MTLTEETLDQLNPEKINDLSQDQLNAILSNLDNEDLKKLAETYPNKPKGNNYLILKDNRKTGNNLLGKSTWGNLYYAKVKGGQKYLSAYTTTFLYLKDGAKTVTAPTQDLTKDALKGAEGLKQVAQPQTPVAGPVKNDDNPDNPTATNVDDQNPGKKLTALELIDQINGATNVDDVVKIVGDDKRKTVVEAADAKILELKGGND